MAVLFAGQERGDFNITGTAPSWSTNLTTFDEAYTRGSMLLQDTGTLKAPLNEASREFYASQRSYATSTLLASNIDLWGGYNASGVPVFRVVPTATGFLQVHVYNSSGDVIASSADTSVTRTRWVILRHTVYCNLSASGEVTVSFAGQEISVTGDFSACSDVVEIAIGKYQTCHISEVIVDTTNIFNARLETLDFTADGVSQDWTGSVNDIKTATSSDATVISSSTANDDASYVASDSTAGSLDVRAVVISARALRGAGGPQNLAGLARVSSTNYVQAANQPETSLGVCQAVFATNPATGSAWTRAEINAAEFGVRSQT